MPKIKICKARDESNMKSGDTLESHRTAAEVLAKLSSGGDSCDEKHENAKNLEVDEKKNSEPAAAERFPKTLWKVLSDENNSNVIAWLANGRGFSVYNRKKLISEVLPRYFKTKKYASFTRRLNRWGFGCFTKGQGTYVFHHPMFLRDHPDLSLYMACSKKINDQKRTNHVDSFMNQTKPTLLPRLISPPNLPNANRELYSKMNMLNRLRSLPHIQNLCSTPPIISPLARTPLMSAYVASNDFFPELSSNRTKSIISNALNVLNQSDLKCLEMLQVMNFSQYNRVGMQNSRLTIHHGIRAYAA